MNRRVLRVLLLEDSPADADLIRQELVRSGMNVTAERVASRDAFTRALREFQPDVVLSAHAVARFDDRAALRVLQALRPTAPLIVVADAFNEEAVVACLRAGAENLVLKANLSRLGPAIDAALSVRGRLAMLSPRQLEVLRLVAVGHTTKHIARLLDLSVKTVETHRGAVMKRLAIHDIVGLVRYSVRIGLVTPEA
jgi:DNA-binding NarL/FixJ family response regulator